MIKELYRASMLEKHNLSNQLELKSAAKVNLFLKITGKRDDGYHLLFSLMTPVKLYDRLTLKMEQPEFKITCNDPKVPSDESNLAMQAARLLLKELEKRQVASVKPIAIQLEKNIPVGAGLGGGSSNAASVLLGLNRYFNEPFDLKTLMSMGLQLGADVPFFLYEKPAIATGIGEILEDCEKFDPYFVLLIYPGFSISTASVYKKVNFRLTNIKKKNIRFSFKKEKFRPDQHMQNDLEKAAFNMHPELSGIKTQLIELGACGALMSGSGSTVYGLFTEKKVALNAYEAAKKNKNWQIYLTNLKTE